MTTLTEVKIAEATTVRAFDIFQKAVFCLALYTDEANLQMFVMI